MKADIAIVGAGMAGASLAAALAGPARILLLEAENRPGYHSTGRSAAFWSETYGGPLIQPLTSASGPALAEGGFLSPRRALHLADAQGRQALDAFCAAFSTSGVTLERLGRAEIEVLLPDVRPGWEDAALEPSCTDIDVGGLHAHYLGQARRSGVTIVTDARLRSSARDGSGWILDTTAGEARCDIVVNAAGAWADEVASLCGAAPLGIQPYRRTIAQIRTDPPASSSLPLVIDARARFYFKPDVGGRLWLSPHDETPCPPCDSAPEEIDVATAIDRFGEVVNWTVEGLEHRWSGLRSFAPDRLPVYGFDPRVPGFFWCAGQGGFGIQTAPAAARLAAALLLGDPAGDIDPAPYAPQRFRN